MAGLWCVPLVAVCVKPYACAEDVSASGCVPVGDGYVYMCAGV